jgi:NADH-quinone oxidoreductase subunit G
MRAHLSVHEPKPPADPDSPLAFSMEGSQAVPPSALNPRVWAPGWNSVQALNKFQSEVGGEMRGGDAGVRFLEAETRGETGSYCTDIPAAFLPSEDRWYVVPLYHIFGSDELSVLSPGVAERSCGTYIGLNPADAERLGLEEGAHVSLALEGVTVKVAVKLLPSMPVGIGGVPVGLPGLEGVSVPAWGTVAKAE